MSERSEQVEEGVAPGHLDHDKAVEHTRAAIKMLESQFTEGHPLTPEVRFEIHKKIDGLNMKLAKLGVDPEQK